MPDLLNGIRFKKDLEFCHLDLILPCVLEIRTAFKRDYCSLKDILMSLLLQVKQGSDPQNPTWTNNWEGIITTILIHQGERWVLVDWWGFTSTLWNLWFCLSHKNGWIYKKWTCMCWWSNDSQDIRDKIVCHCKS